MTLDRPGRHNALGAADVADFRDVLREVAANPHVRVLVLTGAGGRTFCAGASLEEMESGEMSGEIFDGLTDALTALPQPTVARLGGSVYGGGAELALCCDFRIGVPGIRLAVPAAELGVCYPLGGLRRYVGRLGLGTASRILLAAEELDAQELHRTGYLTHLVERDALDATVDEMARRLTRLAPLAVRSMKRLLHDLAGGAVDADEALRLMAECAASEDVREGLRAKREGRPPEFRGR